MRSPGKKIGYDRHLKNGKIKDYFIECKNSHKKENIDTAVWNLESSSLNDVDIKKLEEEIHIVFPKEYRAYIMTAAHQFTVLKGNNEIVWIPFENCIGFTEREQFEQEQISIFHEFDDYIKCFFGGEKYIIEDE